MTESLEYIGAGMLIIFLIIVLCIVLGFGVGLAIKIAHWMIAL